LIIEKKDHDIYNAKSSSKLVKGASQEAVLNQQMGITTSDNWISNENTDVNNKLHGYAFTQQNHTLSDGVGLVMVLNATFNNISVISWRSDLLVEGTGVPGKNHRNAASN
jgi:hypothetical protein